MASIVRTIGILKRFFSTRPIVSGPAVDPPANIVRLIPMPTVIAPSTAETGKLAVNLENGAVKNRSGGKSTVGIIVFTINLYPSSSQPTHITIALKIMFDTDIGSPNKLWIIMVIPVTPPKARLCGTMKILIPIAKMVDPANKLIIDLRFVLLILSCNI